MSVISCGCSCRTPASIAASTANRKDAAHIQELTGSTPFQLGQGFANMSVLRRLQSESVARKKIRIHSEIIAYLFRKIRDGNPPHFACGILGYSPLLDLDGFDIVDDLPLDMFHLLFEGWTRNVLTRLLGTSVEAKKIFKAFNKEYMRMKTFKHTPRRTRSLQYVPDFKGSELGTLLFASFPALFKDAMNLPDDKKPTRR